MSGESQWRDLTAMVKYYENGPLPTWIGWYAQQKLPRGFHVGVALLDAGARAGAAVLRCFCRVAGARARSCCSALFQLGIIATANYAFLNYLVLLLGVTLSAIRRRRRRRRGASGSAWTRLRHATSLVTTLGFFAGGVLRWPAELLSPFRIGENYGLFAVMTRARYEIEFQGTRDGKTWIAYPFRYKPQDPYSAPGIYAPYQPRFDWDLWFASLDDCNEWPWVVTVEERLLAGEPSVLKLFARDPFAGEKPMRGALDSVAVLVHHAARRSAPPAPGGGARRSAPTAPPSRDMPAA